MLVGEYNHTIDDKGRMAIPYRMRRKLEEGAVITRGIDQCIALYSKEEWEKVAQKIATLPMANGKARRFARFILGGAVEVEFDKQGRILIPNYLREYAGLKGEVLVVGVYTHVEIWHKKIWIKEAGSVALGDDLIELGI